MKKISGRSKLLCVFCQGRGIQPGTERLSCIVCKGRGRFTIKQPYNICKECGGRGKKAGANLYCWQCHGKGLVEEKRRLLIAESPAPKIKSSDASMGSEFRPQRRKKKRKAVKKLKRKTRNKKSVIKPAIKPITPKIIKIEAKVKEEKKSFFKKFLKTFKIL